MLTVAVGAFSDTFMTGRDAFQEHKNHKWSYLHTNMEGFQLKKSKHTDYKDDSVEKYDVKHSRDF